jgi:beta-lactam-binding protein with PASTA domain
MMGEPTPHSPQWSDAGPTESDECADGAIVSQVPLADAEVEPGTFVNVTYVMNPETLPVGTYTCLTFGAAQAQVKQDGFVPAYGGVADPLPECPDSKYVAQQQPDPGTELEPGSQVLLWTGSETATTTTPPPTTSPPASP